jgi:hypothetical protein
MPVPPARCAFPYLQSDPSAFDPRATHRPQTHSRCNGDVQDKWLSRASRCDPLRCLFSGILQPLRFLRPYKRTCRIHVGNATEILAKIPGRLRRPAPTSRGAWPAIPKKRHRNARGARPQHLLSSFVNNQQLRGGARRAAGESEAVPCRHAVVDRPSRGVAARGFPPRNRHAAFLSAFHHLNDAPGRRCKVACAPRQHAPAPFARAWEILGGRVSRVRFCAAFRFDLR